MLQPTPPNTHCKCSKCTHIAPCSVATAASRALMPSGTVKTLHSAGGGEGQVGIYMSHVTRHASHVTRHTAHVTRHTSHVTRHTSHVTRHTSHVTRHTSTPRTCASEFADTNDNGLASAVTTVLYSKSHASITHASLSQHKPPPCWLMHE